MTPARTFAMDALFRKQAEAIQLYAEVKRDEERAVGEPTSGFFATNAISKEQQKKREHRKKRLETILGALVKGWARFGEGDYQGAVLAFMEEA